MNGEFIYDETLQGVVDGVNKEFTTLYNIDKIEEVFYLGAAYRSISFVDNIVTFGTAPKLGSASPTIDYFRTSLVPPTPSGDVTFGEIIEDVYSKIGQNRLNGLVPNKVYKETQIKQHINNGFNKIKNQRLYRDLVQQYSFNKTKDVSVIGYNASYLNIGTQNYVPSFGIALLKDSVIVEYSNYTDGKLLGNSGVVYGNGDRVLLGYRIPTGVKKISEVIIDGNIIPYKDIREYKIGNYGYTIYRKDIGIEYLILPYSDTNIVTVRYQYVYGNYSADADIVGIDREYFEVLSYYTLAQIFKYREDDRWQIAQQDYKDSLKEYKSFKSRLVDGINNSFNSDILSNF